MRGSVMCAKDSRRPLPVGVAPMSRAFMLVLQIALEHAVLDERRALRGRAFVVDVERAAAARERAVIDDRADAPTRRVRRCGPRMPRCPCD